jgi:3-oxocholest-4-en-26-oate---CoA ligase
VEFNLADLWERVVDTVPDHEAFVHGARRLTFAQADERATRLAHALASRGIGPGDHVALYLYNGVEYLEGMLAALKLRAVPVNVNYRYVEDELRYLLTDADAQAVVFHREFAPKLAAISDQLPMLDTFIVVDDGNSAVEALPDAMAYEDAIAGASPQRDFAARAADDLYVLYTGGTTGMPKGVMWRGEDLFGVLAEALYPLVGETRPDRSADVGALARKIVEATKPRIHLPASPLMHGTGAFSSFQAMFLGGAICTLVGRHFDAHELWQTVQRERVTQMAIVGDAFAKPMLRALEEAEADGKPYDISSLELIISSGVMWSADVKHALMQRGNFICLDSLGSSEGVGFAGSISAPGAEPKTAKFTTGAHTKVFTEDGREVAPGSGDIGRLAVGGHIPVGYYKDPTKSGTTFLVIAGQRWSVPGDFATVEADGSITLLGRGSVVINSGGEKVFPEEVEEAVKVHPDVTDCLVVGIPDERFGEAVTAVVAVRDGATTAPDDIDAALESLARYKRPRRYVFVPQVLRGPNGKADYKWAKDKALDDFAR